MIEPDAYMWTFLADEIPQAGGSCDRATVSFPMLFNGSETQEAITSLEASGKWKFVSLKSISPLFTLEKLEELKIKYEL